MLRPVLGMQLTDRFDWSESPESARVPPDKAPRWVPALILQVPENVPMLGYSRARVGWFKNELSGHAKSEFEDASVLNFECQAFSMAVHGVKSTVAKECKRAGSAGNRGLNDVQPTYADTIHHQPDDMGGEGPFDLLDLGQLWHRNNRR